MITDRAKSAAADSKDWQGGDQTVSSVQLWVSKDRFQKISSSLEQKEKAKPTRRVPPTTSRDASSMEFKRTAPAFSSAGKRECSILGVVTFRG